MSKTAWISIVIIFALMFGNMTWVVLVNQEPAISTITIEKLEFSVQDSGNFTMSNIKIEIPNRSLDWLPLAGITLRQSSY